MSLKSTRSARYGLMYAPLVAAVFLAGLLWFSESAVLGQTHLELRRASASGSAAHFVRLTGGQELTVRDGAIAATLPSGQILIAGGFAGADSAPPSAELFNPATDTFSKLMGPGRSPIAQRARAVAATLPDGQVLIVGGETISEGLHSGPLVVTSAELFNPATDTFSQLSGPGQAPLEARKSAIAATLPDGAVLIAGGSAEFHAATSAELFGPTTDTFSKLTGAGQSPTEVRWGAVVATLSSGEVLIAGGSGRSSAELLSPATDTFSKLAGAGQSAVEGREGAVAATLPSGQVLIAGGVGGGYLSSAELFDPATDTFSRLTGPGQSLLEGREGAVAAVLPSGEILIAGGVNGERDSRTYLSSAELFDPASQTFARLTSASASPTIPRSGAIASMLPSGQVLIAGGTNINARDAIQVLSSAELFNPDTDTFSKLKGAGHSLLEAREGVVAATLPSGDVLIAGRAHHSPTSSAELFNPTSDTFTRLTGAGQSPTEARTAAVAATLPSGEVLIAGGFGGGDTSSSAELFSPDTDIFTKLTGSGQSLTEGRGSAVAATLPSGEVLIAGGQNGGSALASAELFDPTTDTFTKLTGSGQSPVEAREYAVAATLPSGEILIAGGEDIDEPLSSAELFNPATDTFAPLPNDVGWLEEPRAGAVAVTLRSGQVLLAGGGINTGTQESAELFTTQVQLPVVVCAAKGVPARGDRRCPSELLEAPANISTGISRTSASLARGGKLYATGHLQRAPGSSKLVLEVGRGMTPAPGTYTLTLRWKRGSKSHKSKANIRIE